VCPAQGSALAPLEDDRANLRLAGSGSESAFLALVDRYHASLVRVARVWLDDAAHAEALVQRTWSSLLQRLARFDDQSSLKSWLCGALVKLIEIHLGPEHDMQAELSATAHEPAVDPERFSPNGDRWEGHWRKPPVDWADAGPGSGASEQRRAVIEGAMKALPRGPHVVLLLRDVEGLSAREVEQVLGTSAETQQTLLHRARSRIRGALERHHAAAGAS
jgi:RNA polymerase sigma-70 factor (ECF subfamily)